MCEWIHFMINLYEKKNFDFVGCFLSNYVKSYSFIGCCRRIEGICYLHLWLETTNHLPNNTVSNNPKGFHVHFHRSENIKYTLAHSSKLRYILSCKIFLAILKVKYGTHKIHLDM
jgi:hypothetical protein